MHTSAAVSAASDDRLLTPAVAIQSDFECSTARVMVVSPWAKAKQRSALRPQGKRHASPRDANAACALHPAFVTTSQGDEAMIATTASRVSSNTDPEINAQIWHQTEQRMRRVAAQGRDAIERRLKELDEEWDIERYVETMAPTFSLIGLTLGMTRNRAWLLVPLVVQSFFLQHALQGWCPPIPVLRRLGVRTAQEIERERCCLQHHLATLGGPEPCLHSVDSRVA
jgi:hypothetical protein